jgi:hypothetical protein
MTADPGGKWYAKDEADAIITEYQAIAIQAASQLQAERIRTRELEAERDAARADAERLRALLLDTTAVAVTMLYHTHKDDVLKEFSLLDLASVVKITEPLNPRQVESIYREAWDAAIDAARGKE